MPFCCDDFNLGTTWPILATPLPRQKGDCQNGELGTATPFNSKDKADVMDIVSSHTFISLITMHICNSASRCGRSHVIAIIHHVCSMMFQYMICHFSRSRWLCIIFSRNQIHQHLLKIVYPYKSEFKLIQAHQSFIILPITDFSDMLALRKMAQTNVPLLYFHLQTKVLMPLSVEFNTVVHPLLKIISYTYATHIETKIFNID